MTPHQAAREAVARALLEVVKDAAGYSFATHEMADGRTLVEIDTYELDLGKLTDTALTAAAPHIANAIRARANREIIEWAQQPRGFSLTECTAHRSAWQYIREDADAIAATVCGERK